MLIWLVVLLLPARTPSSFCDKGLFLILHCTDDKLTLYV